jgi:translation initiation factor 3 subunit L
MCVLGNEVRFFSCFQEFESCFLFACPKFLSPAPPPADATGDYDYVKEAIKHQTQVFMDEVRQQKMLPTIRRFTV